MLDDFIAQHRQEIIERTRQRVATRRAPVPTAAELTHGVPLFLDQLVARLRDVSRGTTAIDESAAVHGIELWKLGVLVGQVVHGYGDACQAITTLAVEKNAAVTVDEFRTLNLCLDVAIAAAVEEFARRREQDVAERGNEQLGFLAHELRNLLNTTTLAFDAIRSGHVTMTGSTGTILGKSLDGLRDLVTRTLAEVRLESEPPRRDRVLVAGILEDVQIAATMQARSRNVFLALEPAKDLDVAIIGDAQIAASILTNLVQNACKFTRSDGRITLHTRVTDDEVSIDVADQCGGLPPGKAEELFRPYEQRGSDRSGLGLGLAISRKGARALGGNITVVDVPGTGCIFTLTLPRAPQLKT